MKESIERVKRAVISTGYPFPGNALLVNLAPAEVKKEGAALDLPIAVGACAAPTSFRTIATSSTSSRRAGLSQAVSFLNEQLPLEPFELDGEAYQASKLSTALDFADVRGQEAVNPHRVLSAASLQQGPESRANSGKPKVMPYRLKPQRRL